MGSTDHFGGPFFVLSGINTIMANIFDTLNDGLFDANISPRSDEARVWLEDKIAQIGSRSINRKAIMRSEPVKATGRPKPGRMYMFYYDPENKKKLPYYDRFPLVMLVDISSTGFEGLNLHYLPVDLRQRLFYSLLNRASNNSFDENTYLKITYDTLKSMRTYKAFRPCYKRYLTNNIQGMIANVPSNEWENAIHLPTAMFRKKSESVVHAESRRMVEKF